MTTPTDAPYGIRPPAYRLPARAHPGRVRLQVRDLDRSLGYYQDVLGMQLLDRAGAHASLGAPGAKRPLVELEARPGLRPVPRTGRIGLYHFAVLLPDRAALGRFLAHIGQRREPAGMSDHAVSEAIYLHDPDGLGIEVYADRPRESWRHDGRELYMDTQPLDVGGVLAAGAGEPWGGLPAGTTMGHVHLHVGDLERARAFYHGGLGLDAVVWSYPGALFLSAGGYHHHLGVNTWAAQAGPAPEDEARLLEWELLLPGPADVDAAAESLERAGSAVKREDGGAVAGDPWGTSMRVRAEDQG